MASDRYHSPRVRWGLVAALGLTGALPPLATVLAGGQVWVALAAWTLLAALVWVPLTLRGPPGGEVATLALAGTAAGVVAGALDAAMAGDPMLFVIAVVVGAAWGALFGGVAWGWRRRRRR